MQCMAEYMLHCKHQRLPRDTYVCTRVHMAHVHSRATATYALAKRAVGEMSHAGLHLEKSILVRHLELS